MPPLSLAHRGGILALGCVILTLIFYGQTMVGLPPGWPAVLVLILATALGRLRGARATGAVASRATAAQTVAACFWCWAAYKVAATGDHDYGALTFLPLLFWSSAAARETGAAAAASPRAIRRRILWSCGLVAANYAYVLGAHLSDLPPGFRAYLALGAAYWPALGVWVARPLSAPANQERETELWFARHAGSAV